MENTFDLKKFLVENKLTNNSRLSEAEGQKETLTPSDIQKLAQDPKIQAFAEKLRTKYPESAKKLVDFVKNKLGVDVGNFVNESIVNISQSDLDKAVQKVSMMSDKSEDGTLSEDALTGLGWLGALGGVIATFTTNAVPYVNGLLGLAPANPLGGLATVVGSAIGLPVAAILIVVAFAVVTGNRGFSRD
jgi:hypothetical protein